MQLDSDLTEQMESEIDEIRSNANSEIENIQNISAKQ